MDKETKQSLDELIAEVKDECNRERINKVANKDDDDERQLRLSLFLLPQNRKEVRVVVTRLDLFKQLDVVLASRLICALGKLFNNPEDLEKHLSGELAEEELQQINDAALKEGNHPLSFSFKQ